MLKGTKKAIVRTPHRLLGSKSIEDKIIIEWTKDFVTAEEALSQVSRETKTFVSSWKDICKAQEEMALTLRELYEPIIEENAYRPVQETPESSLTAVAQYREFVGGRSQSNGAGGLLEAIEPYLNSLEGPFLSNIKEARECLKSVQKILIKREHKKVDFDRHSNSLQKMLKKRHSGGEALTEKEQAAIAKQEQDLDAATEVFHEIDEKVKTTVPYVLTYMSEFLNLITASLYMTQLKVFEEAQRLLAQFSQQQGLAGKLVFSGDTFDGEPDDYLKILDGWEERFLVIQPRCEQGITTIRDGVAVKKPIGESRSTRREEASKQIQKFTVTTFNKGINATAGIAHKVVGKIPNRYVENITFSSPEHGFFRTEADLLQSAAASSSTSTGHSSPSGSGSGLGSPVSPSSTTSNALGGFSFFRRASQSQPSAQSLSRSSSIQSRPPSYNSQNFVGGRLGYLQSQGGVYGRSPVTSNFEQSKQIAEDEKEAREILKTRVRASMSTAAWALGDSPNTQTSISGRLRGASLSDSTNEEGSNGSINHPYGQLGGEDIKKEGKKSKPQRKVAPGNEKAIALFTFGGEEAGDVAFREGEEIKVLDHGDETDDQWWFGETKDGRVGLFPQSYVRVL